MLILVSFLTLPQLALAFSDEPAFAETVFYKMDDIAGREVQIFYVIKAENKDEAASVVKVVLDIGKKLEKKGFARIRVANPNVDKHPILITIIQKTDENGDAFIYVATTEVMESVIPEGGWMVKHFHQPYDFKTMVDEILEHAFMKRM